jgi:hypothetical protein
MPIHHPRVGRSAQQIKTRIVFLCQLFDVTLTSQWQSINADAKAWAVNLISVGFSAKLPNKRIFRSGHDVFGFGGVSLGSQEA